MNSLPPEAKFVTIDGVEYDVNALTPQIRQTLSLFDAARQKMQNAQVEVAVNQAAMSHFGS